jgi:Putative zinc-finger
MNCENFNDQMPEYLDGSLTTAQQASARQHVEKCLDCQRALARQEAFAKSIRLSLNRETEGLSLRPDTRRNIVKAFEPTRRASIWLFFEAIWRRPAWVGIVLTGLLLLISGRHFYRHPAKIPAQQTAAKDGRFTYAINVPIQTETQIDRRQNNMAVDAVVTGAGVIDLSFSEDNRQSPSMNPNIN